MTLTYYYLPRLTCYLLQQIEMYRDRINPPSSATALLPRQQTRFTVGTNQNSEMHGQKDTLYACWVLKLVGTSLRPHCCWGYSSGDGHKSSQLWTDRCSLVAEGLEGKNYHPAKTTNLGLSQRRCWANVWGVKNFLGWVCMAIAFNFWVSAEY